MGLHSILGHLFSTSFCSPAVLGDRQAAFAADLHQRPEALKADGVFEEDVVVDAVLLERLG